MHRRTVLTSGLAALWLAATPLAAQPSPSAKLPRVLVLSPAEMATQYSHVLRTRLGELGHVDGRNIQLDFRFAGGHVDRLAALAQELVQDGGSGLAAIVAESTPAAVAARKATTTIPIIALVAVDPVGSGLAASLARPGGNVTGVTMLAEEMNAKRVELLHDVFPRARRLAVVTAATSSAASSPGNLRAAQEAGRALGVEVEMLRVDDVADLHRVLSPTRLADFDGFIVVPDVVLTARRADVVALLGASRRPAVYPHRSWAEAGGLISLGPNPVHLYRGLAEQLDRVLRGARPSELPFEQPVKLELVLNLSAARAFGMEPSPALLDRADEVIE